jgi:tRNA threonylcarbamoyladenosine biosynthesis protein TsaB
MKILAVDTATRSCSVAIVDQGSLLAEMTAVSGQTHSKHLMDMIHTVLQTANLAVSDVDGWAVSAGPGSFTGLRIGMSTIKGLAVASGKPVAGVSSLEVLAWQMLPCSDLICPMLDARKGQVYCARYRLGSGALVQELPVAVLSPADAVHDIDEPCVFVGDGAQHYETVIVSSLGDRARIAHAGRHVIRASSVAWLSLERFESGDSEDLARLVPCYIRKSDAELKLVRTRPARASGLVPAR